MHIHRPTAPRGLREFLSEIGVIVLGILIALGGEQLVEWGRARHELTDARRALRAELALDAAHLRAMEAENACADARLRLLEGWAEGKASFDTRDLASMRNRPLLWTLPTTAWDVTKSAAVAAHMPLEERLAYAAVYDGLANQMRHVLDERQAWDLLARYAGKGVLDPAEARRLKEDLGQVRIRDDDRRFNTPAILQAIAALGLKPSAAPTGRDPRLLCGPPA